MAKIDTGISIKKIEDRKIEGKSSDGLNEYQQNITKKFTFLKDGFDTFTTTGDNLKNFKADYDDFPRDYDADSTMRNLSYLNLDFSSYSGLDNPSAIKLIPNKIVDSFNILLQSIKYRKEEKLFDPKDKDLNKREYKKSISKALSIMSSMIKFLKEVKDDKKTRKDLISVIYPNITKDQDPSIIKKAYKKTFEKLLEKLKEGYNGILEKNGRLDKKGEKGEKSKNKKGKKGKKRSPEKSENSKNSKKSKKKKSSGSLVDEINAKLSGGSEKSSGSSLPLM